MHYIGKLIFTICMQTNRFLNNMQHGSIPLQNAACYIL